MSEPELQDPRRHRRDADEALAGSAPDAATILMKVLRMFMREGRFLWGRVLFAGFIAFIWVVAQFGVPALLAMQAVIDKYLDYKTAEREAVAPAMLEQLREDSAATRRAAEGAELGTRLLSEDVQRIDRRVQTIEDGHPHLRRKDAPEK